jgi:AcrR family transcriptional regulator
MFIEMKKRSYALKKRAESQQDTRARIVAATMQLHEEVGARATTISAIADRAGVQRLTVYRHFPDEAALLQACTSHWIELNPPPDPALWQGEADVVARARKAIGALYAYYRRTEKMWDASHRDEPDVPALQPPMQAFRDYLEGVRATLLDGIPKHCRKSCAAIIGHALRFTTWQSLARERMPDSAMASLIGTWLQAALAEPV